MAPLIPKTSEHSVLSVHKSYTNIIQTEEFGPAGAVNYEKVGAKRSGHVSITKKPVENKLTKIVKFNTEKKVTKDMGKERELWYQFEVPRELGPNGLYFPENLYDCWFPNYTEYALLRQKLLKSSNGAFFTPTALYVKEENNAAMRMSPWLVRDGRIFGGVEPKPRMVTDPFDEHVNGNKATKMVLPLYKKANPHLVSAIWDMSDGTSVHVGMEVEIQKNLQSHPDSEHTVTNKV